MADVAPVVFARERLDLIQACEQSTHFWYAPRRTLLLDTIARAGARRDAPLLDAGCGTGALVAALCEQGFDAHGIDPWAQVRSDPGVPAFGLSASDFLASASEPSASLPLDPPRIQRGQVESIPWPDASVATACAFDVIEHVDDERALQELHRVLQPGGHLLLSVPAHAWLWSARDTLAGHRRRYSRRLLRRRVTDAGFVVERLFGYQCLLLPALAVARIAARLRGDTHTTHEDRPRPWMNAWLLALNGLEVRLGRWWRPPTGSSLVLVARKPGGARA